jgi:signal peptidase II
MVDQGSLTRRPPPLAVLLGTGSVILVLDQLTKALVVASLALGDRVEVLGELVLLWHVRNTGAAFSLFEGMTLFFYLITLVALVMIAYFHITLRERSAWLQMVLGLVLGGSLGNLIDRVRIGAVTDFVSVGVGAVRFPTFNVADSSIVIGIAVLVGYLVLFDRRREAART